MSNSELDRATTLLQGMLDAAVSEAAAESSQGATHVTPSEQEPLLPGFAADETIPPSNEDVTTAGQPETQTSATTPKRYRLSVRIAFCVTLAVLTGIAFAVANRLIRPRTVVREVVREVQIETGIPLALLPDSADASLWELLSNMYGPVDGVALQFNRGIATANGVTYRLQLDFCRCGNDIYARVSGKRPFVVRVNDKGRIVKIYPAPRANKPLKELFGRKEN